MSSTRSRSALVTGGAGFIGSHLVDRLLADGWTVTVVDSFDPFYDPAAKRANLTGARRHEAFRLVEADVRDGSALLDGLPGGFDAVVHLAAKAGVRPSIENPVAYQQVNVGGTQTILELARAWNVPQVVLASSSSVYGEDPNVPWREDEARLRPISPYAATKVAGELLGHVYAHLHELRVVALRLFTVYGPRQRPDLVAHKFARRIAAGRPIPLYGDGSSRRDYTFVGDVVDGIVRAMAYDQTPFEVINLGSGRPVRLATFADALDDALGARARIEWLPPQPGDVPQTWAAIDKARRLLGYDPQTLLADGLASFAEWFRQQPEGAGLSRPPTRSVA